MSNCCIFQLTCTGYYSHEWAEFTEQAYVSNPLAGGEESFQEMKRNLRLVPCRHCLEGFCQNNISSSHFRERVVPTKRKKPIKLPEPLWTKDPNLPRLAQVLNGQSKQKKLATLKAYMELLRLRIRAKELYGCGCDHLPQQNRIRAYRKKASKLARLNGLYLRRELKMLSDWSADPMLRLLAKKLAYTNPAEKLAILKDYLYLFQLLIQGQRIEGEVHEVMATAEEIQALRDKARLLEKEIGLVA